MAYLLLLGFGPRQPSAILNASPTTSTKARQRMRGRKSKPAIERDFRHRTRQPRTAQRGGGAARFYLAAF